MKHLNIKEEKLFNISTLDNTQEVALINATMGTNLIINGNDGSGKVETIINIISNCLFTEKKVLVVSKNNDSLDYIYKKLNSIKDQILIVSNSNTKLDYLYNDILKSLNNLSKSTGKTSLSKLKLLSRDIDKKLEILNSISTLFLRINPCGLNLLDMYKLTKQKIDTSSFIYEYYKIYSVKNTFSNYTYTEIKTAVDKLLFNNTINQYVKYRRFKNNKLFSKLVENINHNNLLNAISKINTILNNPLSLELPFPTSKYTEDFISEFLINTELENSYIKSLSKSINMKYNKHLLIKCKINKFNPLYWIKFKSIAKYENENLLKFNTLNNEIFLEFTVTLENINSFIKSFDFIKNIINDDEYKRFIKGLLTKEDNISYLSNLKSILTIYENFNETTKESKNFTNLEIEILNYCYDNIKRKNELKKLLGSIPNLYLFHNIDTIERANADTLNYYKDFEIILKEIQLLIKTKASIVPLGIQYIWNNKVYELMNLKDFDDSDLINYLKYNKYKLDFKYFLTSFKDILLNIYPCLILNYDDVTNLLPNTNGLFDVVIFCDGNNIYSNELESNIYLDNTHIISGDLNNITKGSLLEIYSKNFNISELKYTYNNLEYTLPDYSIFNSYLQKELYETFIKLGFKVKVNVVLSGYTLDVVIYNNCYTKPILILECDDVIDQCNYTIREYNLPKRMYLDSNSLCTIRIWSRDWWVNKKTETKKIIRILDGLL